MELSVIMPMYNAQDIAKNLQEACRILSSSIKDYEIIVVDDGSTNNCLQEARACRNSRVKIVGYRKNQGKGNAIKYGFGFARGRYIVFLDSGRDLNPKQIKSFMKIMTESGADIVVGSKRHAESVVNYPASRRVMSRIYQTVNKMLFNLNVRDTQVGLKLFKRKALEEVMPKIAIKRFAFDLELLVIANKRGFKIVEAPIVLRYKFQSTVNLCSVFWMLWDTAAIFYRLKILRYYG